MPSTSRQHEGEKLELSTVGNGTYIPPSSSNRNVGVSHLAACCQFSCAVGMTVAGLVLTFFVFDGRATPWTLSLRDAVIVNNSMKCVEFSIVQFGLSSVNRLESSVVAVYDDCVAKSRSNQTYDPYADNEILTSRQPPRKLSVDESDYVRSAEKVLVFQTAQFGSQNFDKLESSDKIVGLKNVLWQKYSNDTNYDPYSDPEIRDLVTDIKQRLRS